MKTEKFMSDKAKKKVHIIKKEFLQENICSMWIEDRELAEKSVPMQFASFYCKDGSRLLPRPISICEIDKEAGALRIVFRVAGDGTKEISEMEVNDTIEVLGPLGNGLNPLPEVDEVILVGGGIGIPPILEVSKQLKCKKNIVLGYRNADTFLLDEFKKYGDVYVSTEDGSLGTKGFVTDAIKENGLKGKLIIACGPTPMLKGLKNTADSMNIRALVSMEERMACGIGACLACVCKTKDKHEHTNVHNACVCKDGPVFWADEIEL